MAALLRSPTSDLRTIYVVGPTASGKSALAVELAKRLGAEIICADSQTVRKDMDIGTAKPTKQDMQGVKHHMLDLIGPYDEYSLAIFQKTATSIIEDIHRRGKTAVIVGGTGLYIDSLYCNYTLPNLSSTALNSRHELESKSLGELTAMVKELGISMPKNSLNKRHLINVVIRGGQIGKIGEPSPGSIILGLNPNRELLIDRINTRVEKMFTEGFVDEVKTILRKYGQPPKSFDAIGYRIVMRQLGGEITDLEAKELFKIADRQYAKRQMSWFKRNPNIKWFESPEEAKAYIANIFTLNS